MTIYTIKLHSIVDMITNSSTVIYTYSKNSVDACKKMINELLGALGSDKSCDEMFYVFSSINTDLIIDHLYDIKCDSNLPKGWKEVLNLQDTLSYKEFSIARDNCISDMLYDIATGIIEKPEWLEDLESHEDYNGFGPETTLNIIPKDEKYSSVAKSIIKFLYSTSHEASHD